MKAPERETQGKRVQENCVNFLISGAKLRISLE